MESGAITITFDKLALVKQLEQGGVFSRDQAETLAESIHAVVYEDLATQSALKATETAIRADMTAMEKAIRSDMTAIRTDMAAMEKGIRSDMMAMEKGIRSDMMSMEKGIRSDMKAQEYALKLWMGSMAVGIIAVLGGLMTLFRFIH